MGLGPHLALHVGMTRTTFDKATPKLTPQDDRWVVEVPVEQAEEVLEPSPRVFGKSWVRRVQHYFFHREYEARRFLAMFERPTRGQLAFR
jgi:hypothetical protein